MFQVVDREEKDGKRSVRLELSPDEGGGWGWIADLHHDLEGALRSFRYVAQKLKATYDEGDERGKKVMESIERHIGTIERLKTTLVEPLFPVDG